MSFKFCLPVVRCQNFSFACKATEKFVSQASDEKLGRRGDNNLLVISLTSGSGAGPQQVFVPPTTISRLRFETYIQLFFYSRFQKHQAQAQTKVFFPGKEGLLGVDGAPERHRPAVASSTGSQAPSRPPPASPSPPPATELRGAPRCPPSGGVACVCGGGEGVVHRNPWIPYTTRIIFYLFIICMQKFA